VNYDFPHAGEFYSVLCAFLWSVAIILARKSGEKVSPVPLNLFKGVVGLVLFLITLPIVGVSYWPETATAYDFVILMISGAIGIGTADSVFFASLNRLGAGRSAIVDCLYSPFIMLCSFVYLREPIGLTLLLALALMITAILVGTWQPERIDSEEQRQQLRTGVLLGLLAMFLMAVGIVMAKPVLNRSDPWWATTARLVGGVLLLSIQGTTRRYRAESARCFRPGPLWKLIMPTAVVAAYLAMFFWIAGMTYTTTTTASVLNQTSTIFVLILATIFLKEPLTGRKVIAILLGFSGGVIAAL
jgi:drug/metabolite transporter (DMT)-like permease